MWVWFHEETYFMIDCEWCPFSSAVRIICAYPISFPHPCPKVERRGRKGKKKKDAILCDAIMCLFLLAQECVIFFDLPLGARNAIIMRLNVLIRATKENGVKLIWFLVLCLLFNLYNFGECLSVQRQPWEYNEKIPLVLFATFKEKK